VGKLQQFGLKQPGVRQVSLDHDTCGVLFEFRLTEHRLEHIQGQLSVLVFLHVQVDKLGTGHPLFIHIRVLDGLPIDSGQAFTQVHLILGIIQGIDLSVNTRYLDGNIVYLGIGQRFQVMMVAVVGFAITQHHFTQ